jgi:nitrite reductase/ring-hydroxylating ferredoxin subunit
MAWHAAPGCENLKDGAGMQVEVDSAGLGIFKLGGQWYAIQDFCPHRGGSLGSGELDEDGWVACPLHAWFFNIKSGESSISPTMKIKTFPCKWEQGRVFVDLPDERSFP